MQSLFHLRIDDLNKEAYDICEGNLLAYNAIDKLNLGEYYSFLRCYLMKQSENSYVYNE